MRPSSAVLLLTVISIGFAQQTKVELMGKRRSRAEITQSPSGVEIPSSIQSQPELQDFVEASPVLLDRLSTEYVYGRLVSRRVLAIQVTLVNSNKELDLLVQSIRLVNNGKSAKVQLNAMDKRIIQGLAERGQSQDPRNAWLRTLKGIGTLLTPFPTFINVGNSFVPAVAALNGPGIAGFESIFPDYTVSQVIRISNHAFNANQIITKNNSMNVTVFVPVDMILSREDQRKFAKDPHSIYQEFARDWQIQINAAFVEPAGGPTAFAILGASYSKDTKRLTLNGVGFLPTDTVEVRTGTEAVKLLFEPDVEYVDTKSIRATLPVTFQEKVIQVRILRADGSAKSNFYLWETK